MAKSNFQVYGPYSIQPSKYTKGLVIDDQSMEKLWENVGSLKNGRGIYVFGIRAAKGGNPWYVGMTTRTFEKECSDHSKIRIYNEVFQNTGKGTPILYFIAQDRSGKGKPNNKVLREVEKYFIEVALSKNGDLRNKQGTNMPNWSVSGVIRSGKGKASDTSKEYKKFIGLQ